MVDCEQQFFYNPIISQENFIVLQIAFQAIETKIAKFQHKTFFKSSKLRFTFFSSRFEAYFNHDW